MHTLTFLQWEIKAWFSLRNALAFIGLLIGLAASQQAFAQVAQPSSDAITLTLQPTGSPAQPGQVFAGSANDSPYDTYPQLGQSSDPTIPVPQLGTYDLTANSSSSLMITAAQLQGILGSSATTVTATRLQFRVYLTGTELANLPAYTNVTLTTSQTGTTTGSSFSGTGSTTINLLAGLTSGGTYILDVRFQADASRTASGKTTKASFSDLSGGEFFYANFYITPPPVTPTGGTTTWQGVARGANGSTLSSDTDWNNPANWTNGVPTSTSNAIIPAKTTGSLIVYPILNNSAATYAVKNLTLAGTLNSSRALLSIGAATLSIYGDLNEDASGLTGSTTGVTGVADATQNSTIIFAGGNQIITGNLAVSDVIIAGTGVKSVINVLNPTNILVFNPASVTAGVIVQSASLDNSSGTVVPVFDTTYNTYINLGAAASISIAPGQGETQTSYIKGVSRVTRNLDSSNGNSSNFGNIGLDMKANHSVTSGIIIFRVVGDALTGPTGSTAVPIKRQYQIQGDDNSRASAYALSSSDITFHYLPSADELNGIMESNLTMFLTTTGGTPYTPIGGTLDINNHTVTRTGLPSLAAYTITLGDKTNPLPVSLTAFTATRSNQNALLAWATATEQNNAGFEVQVSTDGATFRKLTFVASQSPNSTQKLAYTYTDAEAGKAGTRYYRLRQVDITGGESFSPVRAVAFEGTAIAVALSAYPNPFVDKVDFNLDATTLGTNGVAQVQLLDMTGRVVREQSLTVQNASLTLNNLSGLRSGLYMARILLPNGSTKTIRVQKQ